VETPPKSALLTAPGDVYTSKLVGQEMELDEAPNSRIPGKRETTWELHQPYLNPFTGKAAGKRAYIRWQTTLDIYIA
jgi:hypothetical protein